MTRDPESSFDAMMRGEQDEYRARHRATDPEMDLPFPGGYENDYMPRYQRRDESRRRFALVLLTLVFLAAFGFSYWAVLDARGACAPVCGPVEVAR